MSTEVLVSTMNIGTKKEYLDLLKNMNISGKSIIINQCPNSDKLLDDIKTGDNKLLSYKEKGLSKSRNKAIINSIEDICIIADNDLKYDDNYENIIKNAYKKYPDADIIAFYVNSLNQDRPTTSQKEGKINFIKSFKISSFQITFKRKSIINKNIKFDEKFGAGSGMFLSGEENIFLVDCLKKKMKIYYVDETIAEVDHNDSTWFKGFTTEYFETIGACYYRMSKKLYYILYLQYALRKYSSYKKNISIIQALKYMNNGKKKFIGGYYE